MTRMPLTLSRELLLVTSEHMYADLNHTGGVAYAYATSASLGSRTATQHPVVVSVCSVAYLRTLRRRLFFGK